MCAHKAGSVIPFKCCLTSLFFLWITGCRIDVWSPGEFIKNYSWPWTPKSNIHSAACHRPWAKKKDPEFIHVSAGFTHRLFFLNAAYTVSFQTFTVTRMTASCWTTARNCSVKQRYYEHNVCRQYMIQEHGCRLVKVNSLGCLCCVRTVCLSVRHSHWTQVSTWWSREPANRSIAQLHHCWL